MSSPRHISYFLLLLPTTGLQVNTSSKPSKPSSTTGQHVPTSPHLLFSTTTYYRSTCQHVVKTLRIILWVNMIPPSHISYFLLLPTRGLYVNTLLNPQNQTITTGHHVSTSQYPPIWSTNNLHVNTSSKHSEQ